jgi:hypothetical protein
MGTDEDIMKTPRTPSKSVIMRGLRRHISTLATRRWSAPIWICGSLKPLSGRRS